MSDGPLGPWEYKGHIMDHTHRTRGNHPGIIDYKGKSYCFGQNTDILRLETDRYMERRSVGLAEMTCRPDGTIVELPYFQECELEQIGHFDPYRKVEAETMAWGYGLKTTPKNIYATDRWNQVVTGVDDGKYILVRGVDFGRGASGIRVSAACYLYGGIIEVHVDAVDGPCIGRVAIGNTKGEYRDFEASLENVTGVHDLYFVFRKGKRQSRNLFSFDSWEIIPAR